VVLLHGRRLTTGAIARKPTDRDGTRRRQEQGSGMERTISMYHRESRKGNRSLLREGNASRYGVSGTVSTTSVPRFGEE
jgi:hypothetical protein